MYKPVLFVSAFLAMGATAQAQWATQPISFANPAASPALIEAVSPTVVWTIGYDFTDEDSNLVAVSTNGGVSWSTSTVTGVDNTSEFVSSLAAISNTTAWVTVVGNRADGRVMKTTDGGQTWVRQTTAAQFGSTTSYPSVVHFFNANDGVVLGDPVTDGGPFELYTTSNGGATWTAVAAPPVSSPREDTYDDAFAVVGNTIWCGTYQGRILRSTDKGLTWAAPVASGLTAVRSIAFRDAQNGLAIFLAEDTGERELSRTTDGGLTWTRVNYTGTMPGFGIDNVPGTNQYVSTGLDLGDGIRGTAYTRDNGQTWVTVESTNNNLFVDFASSTAGWTGGINLTTGAGQGMRRFTSSVLGTRQATAEQLGYSVYPNPSADGHFEVRAQEARTGVLLRVSDALGREVVRRPWTGNGTAPVTLDLSQYQAGVYTLEISSAAGTAHQKLVVK
jgi:photosystem II stability/assembly factor-like uncharacterized protein